MVAVLFVFAADAMPRSTTWHLGPGVSWWLATLLGAGVVLVVWRGDAHARRATAAAFLISGGAYGAVAIGRAMMVTEARPLSVWAATPRYHYVGSLGIVVLLCFVLQAVGRLRPFADLPRGALLGTALAAGAVGYLRADFRIDSHAFHRHAFEQTVREVCAEVQGLPAGATAVLENGDFSLAFPAARETYTAFPGRAGVVVIVWRNDVVDGRRVRFIERHPHALAWHHQWPESLLGTLLVAPDPGVPPRTSP